MREGEREGGREGEREGGREGGRGSTYSTTWYLLHVQEKESMLVHTISLVSQFKADDPCLVGTPSTVADGPPVVVDAHLHPPLGRVATIGQTYVPI